MKPRKFDAHFATLFDAAVALSEAVEADAVLLVSDGMPDWGKLRAHGKDHKIVVAVDNKVNIEGAEEHDVDPVLLSLDDAPVFDQLTQALLESVASEVLIPKAKVVALYSGFEAGSTDSISYIRLDEHLGKLTARDLRRLETSVPLEILKMVVDLAVEIGREGREGKPVGTIFVVGDSRKVIGLSHPAGYDPVKGYSRKERDLRDHKVREAIKEVAQLDGAFIVTGDGVVEKSCRILNASNENIIMSKGLGARHWAAAAISKAANCIAVTVSESSGTVRIFQNGEVILRVEPFRRAMKWKDFDYESPAES